MADIMGYFNLAGSADGSDFDVEGEDFDEMSPGPTMATAE
jgi:hypothetical protein